MGWTEYHATHYKNGRIDRKAECDSVFNDSMVYEGKTIGKYEVLKSAMVGSVYYAAVKKTKFATETESEHSTVFGAVFLTSTDSKHYYNFAYKDMDESCGPYDCKCPQSILKLLSPTDSEWASQWRERCWEYHNSKSDKPSLGALKVGSIVEFTAKGEKYLATKTYGMVYIRDKKIIRIDTYWKLDHYYTKASSRVINSWGYTVVHKATKEDEQKLREERIANVRF